MFFPFPQEFEDYIIFPKSNEELARQNTIPLLPYESTRNLRRVLAADPTESVAELKTDVTGVAVAGRPHRSRANINSKTLAALEGQLGNDRVREARPSVMRDIQSGYGMQEQMMLNQMLGNVEAMGHQVNDTVGSWYNRILQSDRFRRFLPLADHAVSLNQTKLSEASQQVAIQHDTFVESAMHLTANMHSMLKPRIAALFGGTNSLPTPRNKKSIAAFKRVDGWLDSGAIDERTAFIMKFAMIAEEPQNFKFVGANGKNQKTLLNSVQNIMNDQRLMESRQFSITFDEIENNYFAHLFETPDFDGIDETVRFNSFGRPLISVEGQEKIFGTKQFFTKNRRFPLWRTAIANSTEPLKMKGDITDPADIIAARLLSGNRMAADSLLNGELDRMAVAASEQSYLKRILGGKPLPFLDTAQRTGLLFRSFKFGAELGALGVQAAPVLGALTMRNPIRAAKTAFVMMQTLVHPDSFRRWSLQNYDRIMRFKQAGGHMALSILEDEGKRSFVERPFIPHIRKGEFGIRGKWNPIAVLNDAQFGRAMMVLKVELFDTLEQAYNRNSPINKALSKAGFGIDHATDPGLASRAAAAHVDNVTGGVGNSRRLAGPNRRAVERTIDITPSFFRSTLTLFGQAAATGGPEGALARDFLMRLFIIHNIVNYGLEFANTGEWPDAEYWNPRSARFLRAKTGTDVINPSGRFATLTRRGSNVGADVWQILTTGNFEDLRTGRESQRLVRGRLSIPLSTIDVLATQRGFQGDPVFTDEPVGFNRTTLGVLGQELLLPIVGSQLQDDINRGTVTKTSIIGAIFGLNSFPIDKTQESIQELLVDELVRAGADPASAAANVRDFRAFEAKDATGEIVNLSISEQATIIDQVARRMGWIDPETGIPAAADTDLVRSFGFQRELTNQERKVAEENGIRRYFSNFEAEDRLRTAAYDDIAQSLADGNLTVSDAFDRIARVNQATRFHANVTDELFSDILLRFEKDRTALNTSQKELLFRYWADQLDAATNPDGSVDSNKRFQITRAIEASLGDDANEWWADFNTFRDSRTDQWPTIVRLYNELQEAASPFWNVKNEVLDGADLTLYNQWANLNTDRAVQTQFENENPEVFRLISEVDQGQIELLTSGDFDGARMETALWLLTGRQPQFNGDAINASFNLGGAGSQTPRNSAIQRATESDLTLEELLTK